MIFVINSFVWLTAPDAASQSPFNTHLNKMTQQHMQVNLISNVHDLPADDSTTSRDLVDICCLIRVGPHIVPFTTYSPKVLGNAGAMTVVSGQGGG